MLIFETSGRFPFRTMRLLGWTLITLGFVLLVLDITDVAYTAANFENDCDSVNDYAEWQESPCDHDDHIYAYIASGIWSSILIIITGIIGARFSKWNIQHLRFQRDLFAVLSILCALLFIPTVIVMHALELKTLKDMGAFYYDGDDLKTRDEAKFALPMVILMIVCLIFIVAAMTAIVSCCCAPVSDTDENVFTAAPNNTEAAPFEFIPSPDAADAAVHAANRKGRSTVRTHPMEDRSRRPSQKRHRHDESWSANSHNGYPGPYMHPTAEMPSETSFINHPGYPGYSASNYQGSQGYEAAGGPVFMAQPPGPGFRAAGPQEHHMDPPPQRVFWAPAESVYRGRYRDMPQSRRAEQHPQSQGSYPQGQSQPWPQQAQSVYTAQPQQQQQPRTPRSFPEPPQEAQPNAFTRPQYEAEDQPPTPPPPRPESGYVFPTNQSRMPSTIYTPDGPSYYMGAVFNNPTDDPSSNQFGDTPVTHVFDSTA